MDKFKDWIERVKLQPGEAEQCDAEIECDDSVSRILLYSQISLCRKASVSSQIG